MWMNVGGNLLEARNENFMQPEPPFANTPKCMKQKFQFQVTKKHTVL